MGLIKDNRFFLFWSGLVFLTLLVIWQLPWRFQVNDDVIMMWLVSGAYTGEPEPYVVFIHPFLSEFLAFLYQKYPDFNWYGLLMFLGLGIGTIGLLWAIEELDQFFEFKLFLASLVYLIFVNLIFFVQFTLVAGWLTFSGVFLLNQVRKNSKINWFALSAILFGFLVRWEAAILISLSFFCLFIYRIFAFYKVDRKMFIKLFLIGILAAISYFSKQSYERGMDSDSQEFLIFNNQRSAVLDHPILFKKIYEESIDSESIEFYLSRWLFEGTIPTLDQLEKLEENYNSEYHKLESIIFSFKRFFLIQKKEFLKSFVILVIIVVSFLLPKRTILLFVLPWILFYFILNHFFLFYGRVNLLFFLVLTLSWNQIGAVHWAKRWLVLINFLIILVLGVHGYNFYKDVEWRKKITSEFDCLIDQRKSETLILVEGVFPETLIKHYSTHDLVPFLHLGWLSRSPFQKKNLLNHFGKPSIIEFDDYYLLAIKMPESIVYPDFMNLINPKFSFGSCLSTTYLDLNYFKRYE